MRHGRTAAWAHALYVHVYGAARSQLGDLGILDLGNDGEVQKVKRGLRDVRGAARAALCKFLRSADRLAVNDVKY